MTQKQWLEGRVAFCEQTLQQIDEDRHRLDESELRFLNFLRHWQQSIEQLTPEAAEMEI
jgi:hypothetical protein